MEKLLLVALATLLLTTLMLNGCILVPVEGGRGFYDGGERGEHRGGEHRGGGDRH